ncbi:MAG: hypothetical protein R6X25_11735 [Candidatus Krumholzibacteriia bacterium]
MRQRAQVEEVLRSLTLLLAAAVAAAAAEAADGPAIPAMAADRSTPVTADADTADAPDRSLFGRLLSRFETDPPGRDDLDIAFEAELEVMPYLPYAGQHVRRVIIARLSPFGRVEADSFQVEGSRIEHLLDGLTRRTRPWLVRRYLRVQPGDEVAPFRLADSERILRELPYVSDVRITLHPVPGATQLVDAVVVVREAFPLGAELRFRRVGDHDAAVYHRNLAGAGIDLEVETLYREDAAPELGLRTRLAADNLVGQWWTASLVYRDDQDWLLRSAGLERDFRFPGIRVVGGGRYATARDRAAAREDTAIAGVRWRQQDLWLGRTLAVSPWTQRRLQRAEVVLAGRWIGRRHAERPPVSAEIGAAFHDRDLFLLSLYWFSGRYYRTRLVTAFDQVEDVFDGIRTDVTVGWEAGEFDDRPYTALRLGAAGFLGGDYLRGRLELGGYRDAGRLEDGVLRVDVSGFTRLTGQGVLRLRHFLGAIYTLGLNQQIDRRLRLDVDQGIRGLVAGELRGGQRLTGSYEGVLFTPLAPLGFRTAIYAFADVGLIGGERDPIFTRTVYGSLGGGVRLKNPRLVFDAFQLQVAYLPTTFTGGSDLVVKLGGARTFSLGLPGPRPDPLVFE